MIVEFGADTPVEMQPSIFFQSIDPVLGELSKRAAVIADFATHGSRLIAAVAFDGIAFSAHIRIIFSIPPGPRHAATLGGLANYATT